MLDNLPEDEKDRMGVIAGCTVPEFEDMVELATTLKTEVRLSEFASYTVALVYQTP
jgi:hypothetical protein